VKGEQVADRRAMPALMQYRLHFHFSQLDSLAMM
jgi:hypothetical protein